MNHKIINLLGLAQRAGKLTSGDFIVEKSIKKRDAKLVFLAIDTASNNEKKYKELTTACGVPVTIYDSNSIGPFDKPSVKKCVPL